MVLSRQVEDLAVVGDSRIVIQQAQGFIHYHQPNLQKHLAKCEIQKGKFRSLRLVHNKREHNQAADYLTSKTLALGEAWSVQDSEELVHLERVEDSRNVDEAKGCTPGRRSISASGYIDPEEGNSGVFAVLTGSRARDVERRNPEVDGDTSPNVCGSRRPMGLLKYQAERWRRIRNHQDQDPYLSEIKSFLKGDFERFSPKRLRKITKVADLFALAARDFLYRLARTTRDRPRDFADEPRLVIPEPLRPDDPRFMSEVFTRFRELQGSKQRANLAYRPQANDQLERSVQTVVRSIRAYIAEADQSDWDDHAERLTFALNISFDATRLDTPFYLVHSWDAQRTLSAMFGPKPSSVPERAAYKWRQKIQGQYSYAKACAEDLQKRAKRQRSEAAQVERVVRETEVWIREGRPGLVIHSEGPTWPQSDTRPPLKIGDTGYRVNPRVHVSRRKPRALFPKRPTTEVEVSEDDDFDAVLLPEDSWEPDSERDEYEVEKILDLR
ncbi:hypothetical protein ON010_g13370 [Phytophthora cinnamomi]|nr:hypothetical protein ON010_g13370 [Phytophthora cinnamomi]